MSIELVQSIKTELEEQGEDLSGPCGAFKITQRVAWAKRFEGYGLLGGKSPGQNGCTVGDERYSVDWILKPDGHGVDCLMNAGGNPENPSEPANVPTWNEGTADPSLYRPAIDPGDSPEPPDPPDPEPPNPPDDDVEVRLAALEETTRNHSAAIVDLHRRVSILEEHVHRIGFPETSTPKKKK